jgi:hypothetical protein
MFDNTLCYDNVDDYELMMMIFSIVKCSPIKYVVGLNVFLKNKIEVKIKIHEKW